MSDDGASSLVPLELDPFGNISNWPDGFFGDEMGDLVAMTEAAMKRQMNVGAWDIYWVVDTNVPIVASNKAPQASPECVVACAKYLQNLEKRGILVIDSNWLIINEYKRKNSTSG
jgi:hypothetical protein